MGASAALHVLALWLIGMYGTPLPTTVTRRLPSEPPVFVTLLSMPSPPANPDVRQAPSRPRDGRSGGSRYGRIRAARRPGRVPNFPLSTFHHQPVRPRIAKAAPIRIRAASAHEFARTAVPPQPTSTPAAIPSPTVPTPPASTAPPATMTPTPPVASAVASAPSPSPQPEPADIAPSATPAAAAASGASGDAASGNGLGSGTGTGAGSGPFGIATETGAPRHIVYLLDISLSMPTRIERAEQELRDALAALGPGDSFDIIAFCHRLQPFDTQLVPVTKQTIGEAHIFLGALSLDTGTDLQSALYQALGISGVNEVVVITDGVPTVGVTNFHELARHVHRRNHQHVRIDTIGLVGQNPDGSDDSFEASKLLQELASDSGGQCKLVELGVASPD